MKKRTWHIYLILRATGQDKYLGYVYEASELEAMAVAESLHGHNPDESYLEVRPL